MAITKREQEQIEKANASGKTPAVFIHGLWLLPSSWDRWAAVFEEAGYAALTPVWPDDPETVEEARANPDILAKKTIGQVADHTAEVIGQLQKNPAVLGHSTGGLLAQIIAGPRSLGRHGRDRSRSVPRRPAPALLDAEGVRARPLKPAQQGPRRDSDVRPVQVRLDQCAG